MCACVYAGETQKKKMKIAAISNETVVWPNFLAAKRKKNVRRETASSLQIKTVTKHTFKEEQKQQQHILYNIQIDR